MPSLTLIKSPGGTAAKQTYKLDAGTVVIGREDGCDIVIPNNAVSRRHAQILRADGQFVLEDLKSRNRTFLNNKEVGNPVPLKNDDKIKICDFLFLFTDERGAAHRPLPRDFARPGAARNDDDDDPAAPPDDDPSATTVQHTVGRGAAQQLLDTQPSERLRALLEISTSLSRTLDLDPLLNQIADTMFRVFKQADRCFLILTEPGGQLVPKVARSRRPGAMDAQFSKTIVRKCLEKMEGYLSEDASAEASFAAAQSIAALQIRSVMIVPLMTADGKPLGAIQLDTLDYFKKFKEDDLKLLTIVANVASVAVEKAEVHQMLLAREKQQQEIELAKKVQLGFLPQKTPDIAGYEFFAFYSAAQTVGGDYYDFIPLPDGRMAVVLGDVAGKGVPASLLMAKLSAEARYCLLTQPDPAKAVSLLNEQLIRGGIGDRFVTLAAVVLDPKSDTVTVVNAGHINPTRYKAPAGDLADVITDAQSGLPLGLVPGFEYEAVTLPLAVGESLLVFTDGVTDAMSPAGDMFGFEGIRSSVTPDSAIADHRPKAVGDRLVRGVRGHASGRAQNDDIAVVCLGRLEPSGPNTGSEVSGRWERPATVSDLG